MSPRAGVLTFVAVCLAVLALGAAPIQEGPRHPLADPASFNETAPESYRAIFQSSAGMFIVQVQRAWAPYGADRFYNLVKRGFYDECRFFRVIKGFAAQFGIHGNPAVAAAWVNATLPPDRARLSNTRGRVTFAMAGRPDTRSTQVFINLGDNSRLDIDGFAPIGEIVTSMVLVDRIFSQYGEGADQGRIQMEGNAFLTKYMPRLDYVIKATIE
jgi:peptidyl-prolyl cis-trans isomerase A (cyclophilin A)